MFRSFCRPRLDECPRVEEWFTGLRVVMKRGHLCPQSPLLIRERKRTRPATISHLMTCEHRAPEPVATASAFWLLRGSCTCQQERTEADAFCSSLADQRWYLGVLAEGWGSSLSSCRQHNVIIGTTTVQLHGTVSLHIRHR